MKKSKRQAEDIHIETIYDPYRKSAADSFDVIYQRYLDDRDRIIEIDGLTYYKAAQIMKFNIRHEISLEVALPWKINPDNNCIIVDDNGNQYKYKGATMMRFRGEIPEWHSEIVFAILSFPEGIIGEYFAKQIKNKE